MTIMSSFSSLCAIVVSCVSILLMGCGSGGLAPTVADTAEPPVRNLADVPLQWERQFRFVQNKAGSAQRARPTDIRPARAVMTESRVYRASLGSQQTVWRGYFDLLETEAVPGWPNAQYIELERVGATSLPHCEPERVYTFWFTPRGELWDITNDAGRSLWVLNRGRSTSHNGASLGGLLVLEWDYAYVRRHGSEAKLAMALLESLYRQPREVVSVRAEAVDINRDWIDSPSLSYWRRVYFNLFPGKPVPGFPGVARLEVRGSIGMMGVFSLNEVYTFLFETDGQLLAVFDSDGQALYGRVLTECPSDDLREEE